MAVNKRPFRVVLALSYPRLIGTRDLTSITDNSSTSTPLMRCRLLRARIREVMLCIVKMD